MLPPTALQFVQQHPQITTNSPEFRNLGLRDDQCQELAYQLIESSTFIGQTTTICNSKGWSSETEPVTESQVGTIKKYLKAFIDVDRSALEGHFPGFNAVEAKRRMVYEIIDKRQELYRLYVEYKRDVVERTRARIALPPPSPMTPQVETTRVSSLPQEVSDRDGGVCRVTGVASVGYWKGRGGEALDTNVGYGCFMMCEVAHGIPRSVDQSYWELIRRLLGVSPPFTSMDIAQNAMLLQIQIYDIFQDFELYFDPGFVLRRRPLVGAVDFSGILSTVHVRQGVPAIDGRFLDQPILPCRTNPSIPSVPDVEYAYFLLHKLIGDIVFMAGGGVTLGLDEFGPDEDPWTAIHLVSKLSLPALDDKLYRIQELQQSAIDDPQPKQEVRPMDKV